MDRAGGGGGSIAERNELEGPVNSFTAAPLQTPPASASRQGAGGSTNQTNREKRN